MARKVHLSPLPNVERFVGGTASTSAAAAAAAATAWTNDWLLTNDRRRRRRNEYDEEEETVMESGLSRNVRMTSDMDRPVTDPESDGLLAGSRLTD